MTPELLASVILNIVLAVLLFVEHRKRKRIQYPYYKTAEGRWRYDRAGVTYEYVPRARMWKVVK